ncbi:hypothetical protein [Mameliella alba]|uniref:COG3904 family protein n=1 Tax=Mameliella alba TaxID=561184 RepID=UPI000B52A352|nr:hypothetical protein [Mameliella alba]OWV63041.1 hypothetical protein CDZ98_02405 [Mameliella alba]
MRLFPLLAICLFLPLPLFSGTLSAVGPLPYDDRHPSPRPGCTHRFDGQVAKGDLDAFKALPTDPQVVVCLDSPGGSFLEGIAIGEYIRQVGIGTRLEAGTTCESACSIIFMSGTYIADEVEFGNPDDESWQLGHHPWRTMHPTARLGLHAPRLEVTKGQYDEANVTRAYDVALQTLAEFSRRLMSSGPSYAVYFDPDLFSAMIATPHGSMFYIDTVKRAIRFKVEVGPVRSPVSPDEAALKYACANFYGWNEFRTQEAYEAEIAGAHVDGTKVTLAGGLNCTFEKGGKETIWQYHIYDFADLNFYAHDMPLSDLAP